MSVAQCQKTGWFLLARRSVLSLTLYTIHKSLPNQPKHAEIEVLWKGFDMRMHTPQGWNGFWKTTCPFYKTSSQASLLMQHTPLLQLWDMVDMQIPFPWVSCLTAWRQESMQKWFSSPWGCRIILQYQTFFEVWHGAIVNQIALASMACADCIDKGRMEVEFQEGPPVQERNHRLMMRASRIDTKTCSPKTMKPIQAIIHTYC